MHEIADFNIRSENAIAHDQLNRKVRIFCLELAHQIDGGISGITDAEDQLKPRIILFAVTAKTLRGLRIDTFQRLKNGDGRELVFGQPSLFEFLAPIAEKAGEPESGQKIKKKSGDGSDRGHDLEHYSWS